MGLNELYIILLLFVVFVTHQPIDLIHEVLQGHEKNEAIIVNI